MIIIKSSFILKEKGVEEKKMREREGRLGYQLKFTFTLNIYLRLFYNKIYIYYIFTITL